MDLQEEIACEMAGEALVEQYQLAFVNEETVEEEEWDDEPYDELDQLEHNMVGVEAYAHHNEEARLMWWMEEGRFG